MSTIGRLLSIATAQNSAEEGGKNYKAYAEARQRAGKRLEWDVKGGSGW